MLRISIKGETHFDQYRSERAVKGFGGCNALGNHTLILSYSNELRGDLINDTCGDSSICWSKLESTESCTLHVIDSLGVGVSRSINLSSGSERKDGKESTEAVTSVRGLVVFILLKNSELGCEITRSFQDQGERYYEWDDVDFDAFCWIWLFFVC